MPFFEENPLRKLALAADTRDAEPLPLHGLPATEALERLEQTIGRVREHACPDGIVVTFDQPFGDGRETLFLPIGRRLLEARRAGHITRCLPLAEGNGYYFE